MLDTPSYQKINYALRPAKSTERRMICDGINRLSFFSNIKNYQYIGFGSPYFTDFILIHKTFGITNLICVEKHDEDQCRFEFNRPYKCINLIFGDSNAVLPSINWEKPTILWLDYDKCLDSNKLEDISNFFLRAISGSMIVITINIDIDSPRNTTDNIRNSRFKKLIDKVGGDRIPVGISAKDLIPENYSGILRKIITNEIEETLSRRNGGLAELEKFDYHQVYYFTYRDTSRMMTLGGVLCNRNDIGNYYSCSFNDLEFFRDNENDFPIEVPKLTFREIRCLEKKIPNLINNTHQPLTTEDLSELDGIPLKDIEAFINIYRYFPNYAEIEI